MRIAHVVPVFPPYRGGTGNVAFHQARHLAARGARITVFTCRTDLLPIRPDGVDVVSLSPMFAYRNAACLPQILWRAGGYDLVHLHYPFFGTAELLAARRMLGGPPLLLQYQFDVIGEGWLARLFRWHRRLLLPLVVRAADGIIVTSRDYLAGSFIAPRLSELDPRIEVLPVGVDLAHFHPATERPLPPRGFRTGGPHVLFVGGLDRAHYFKGLHVLLSALSRLPNVCLVAVGEGDLRPAYESRAAELGIAERVSFVGSVPDEELPAFYQAADVVVLPSIDRTEAFGMVLLEAMASAKAVVASRLPGVRTLIEEGRNGYLADPGDADQLAQSIRRALERSRQLGLEGRRIAEEKFGWPALTGELVEIYRRTLERRS